MEKNRFKGFLTFLLLASFMAFSLGSFAQTKQVTGTVTEDSGATIPGVSIVVQGTTVGTITDLDGKFTLNVPSEANVLVFSYVGMLKQEIEIGNQTIIDVLLQPDVIGVDEIVVIGYGTRMKEELTGAVSTVSAEKLAATSETSVVSRLQGQVAGVTVTSANRPGGDATIRIRGVGTINDPNPLYIIDGVPASPGNNIAPGDIESISVLKDASSAAIYGSRGANGVIIITTKRGRINQDATVTFTARTGVSNSINQYDLLNTQEYAEAVWLSFANNGAAPSHAQYGSGSTPVIPDYILPNGAMSGQVDEASYNYPGTVIFKANKEGTNWYDEIYQTGIVQEYDLSVSGGGQKGTYSFSGNYLNEEGMLKHTDFKRYTFRMNSDAKFNKWFKAGESLQVIYIDENGNLGDNDEGTVISQAYRAQPIIPVYDIGGNFAGSKAPEMGNASNPLSMLYRAKDNNGKYVRILGNVFGEVTLMDGLTAKTLLGYNFGQWNGKSYVLPTYEHSEPNMVNGVNAESNYSLQWNWSNTINYNATFDEIHKINVIAGTEAIQNTWQSLNASRRVYFSESPEYMQLDSGESNKENSGTGSEWSLFSVFGRVNYDLMGKYFIEGTVRRDGSSRFSEANRYGTFPAASAAWAVSEESFMAETSNWLDLLKVRVGWGVSGNDRIGNYNSYSTYGTSSYKASYAIDGSNTSAYAGFRPATLGNEDVTWETTETINLGIDANMLDNHLAVSVDVWQRNTSDMLFQEPIPQVMGVASAPFVNIGEMKNTGIDFELGYNNSALDGKLTYNASLTLSHYKNEIVQLSGDPDRTIDAASERQMTYTRYANGTAFPEFFGYVVEGIFQTQAEADAHAPYGTSDYNAPGHFKYQDVDGSGVIDADDRTFIGSPHPDLTGGLNIDLGYGAFDLNMFFYGSLGNEMVNYVTRWIDYGMFNGGLSKDALYESWGSPYLANNADATLPMLDQSDISQQPSTAFVEDASFLRMKNLRLGYTLPQSILDKAQIKRLSVYAQVSNVFTITKYSGLDPEVRSSGSNMGLDMGAWPTPRQIMFGVTLGL
ncbi:MAG: TonB-dependent receptor [Prolixibacteraceae bacterium]|jgi:TonB-linked SusC/RagA family outer membrane protein|nr:TonB-dependent receptor [Prolixibacteraceae bacterium]MBT6998270.1 TonB-dependent receptor [Prolixibacteraceae bacterium]MBT7393733.1 TonB-dependent receptor [Prolixibacteraceae bacterium]